VSSADGIRAVVEANPRLALAVVVGRQYDERGVAAGDTDAFRALRLDAPLLVGRSAPSA